MLTRSLIQAGRLALNRSTTLRMAEARAAYHVADPKAGYPPNLQPGHMDEMPVPQGPWKESYERYQKKYNMQLAAGILFLVGTITFIYTTEAIDFVLAPPMKNPK